MWHYHTATLLHSHSLCFRIRPLELQAFQNGGNATGHWASASYAMGYNPFVGHEIKVVAHNELEIEQK